MNGARKPDGFSLIEALVTLLVLSLGVLALVRLQVRLWVAAEDLHVQVGAQLRGANLLETAPLAWLPETARAPLLRRTGALTEIRLTRQAEATDGGTLTVNRAALRWQRPAGQVSQPLRLEISTNADDRPADSRWLLPEASSP